MKQFILIFCITCFTGISGAQINKMRDLLEDVQTEMNDGKFTLRFFDALTGEQVTDATVSIKNIGDFVTDSDGKVLFDAKPDGYYHFTFSKKGYIKADYRFEVIANTIFYNRFTVSPRTELGAVRIVLDWDKNPGDLDIHLEKKGSYHISYRNMKSYGDVIAMLDRDDTNGYGPETITIYQTDNEAQYICYVVDYSNLNRPSANELSKSKATVRIYNNNELTDTFYVPVNRNGNKWNVFTINKSVIQGNYSIERVN